MTGIRQQNVLHCRMQGDSLCCAPKVTRAGLRTPSAAF